MGAGQLDRRITIERFGTATNSFNEEVESWFDFTTVWAGRKDVSDGERYAAGVVGSFLMTRFRVRSSTKTRSIMPKDRIKYGGDPENPDIWNITGAKETKEGRGRYIEITATRDNG